MPPSGDPGEELSRTRTGEILGGFERRPAIGDGLLSSNGGEAVEKVIKGMAGLNVVYERLRRYTGASEAWLSDHDLRIS